jgi:hypothetical protein
MNINSALVVSRANREGRVASRLAAACLVCCGFLLHLSAAAEATCAPFLDDKNQLAIGHLSLGLAAADVPTTLRKLPCGTAPAPGEDVCEAIDEHGFAYLIDAQSIIRIEARLGVLNKTGLLPLGLKLGDTKKIVRSKIIAAARKSSAQNLPVATLGSGKKFRQNTWATHYCVNNALGASGSWYLNFDRHGRLVTVGIRLNI